jgi:MFS transporter, ACS family, allantoate permease
MSENFEEPAKLDKESMAAIDTQPAKAMELLREGEIVEDVDSQEANNKLRWKLDLTLLPLLCLTYALQSIDKTTLGYAAVFGLEDDLHLVGTEYSWLGAIFYLGYLIWEFPTNLFLQKLPLNRFMAGTVRRPQYDYPDLILTEYTC